MVASGGAAKGEAAFSQTEKGGVAAAQLGFFQIQAPGRGRSPMRGSTASPIRRSDWPPGCLITTTASL